MAIFTNSSLPRWMVAIAFPTFAMPALLVVALGWECSVLVMRAWDQLPPPLWLVWGVVGPMITLMLLLWPLYIIWAWKSTQLTRQEKFRWIVILLWLTVIGMPVFYVFMVRRYTGAEHHIRPQEAVRVERFLARHGLRHAHLSQKQYSILAKYIRSVHFSRWALIPLVLLAVLMLYVVLVVVPEFGLSMFSEWLPIEHRVIVDETHTILQETVPEQEFITLFLQEVMMMGVASGMFGTMTLMFLALGVFQLFTVKRKLFIEFLHATEAAVMSSEYERHDGV
jgi:hypothetical protein